MYAPGVGPSESSRWLWVKCWPTGTQHDLPLYAKARRELSRDPYYQTRARENHECQGQITWEHALTYAGRQIQERFAIIPLCEFHHSVSQFRDGGGMNMADQSPYASHGRTPHNGPCA
jgi:hypothetical protein